MVFSELPMVFSKLIVGMEKKQKKKKNCVKDGVRSAVEGSSVALNPGLLGSSVEATPAWNASAC